MSKSEDHNRHTDTDTRANQYQLATAADTHPCPGGKCFQPRRKLGRSQDTFRN